MSPAAKGHETRELIAAMTDSALFLNAAIATGSATMTLTIPVVEAEAIPVDWYRNLWWAFSGLIALVSGLFVSVGITLLVTVIGAVGVLGPERSRG